MTDVQPTNPLMGSLKQRKENHGYYLKQNSQKLGKPKLNLWQNKWSHTAWWSLTSGNNSTMEVRENIDSMYATKNQTYNKHHHSSPHLPPKKKRSTHQDARHSRLQIAPLWRNLHTSVEQQRPRQWWPVEPYRSPIENNEISFVPHWQAYTETFCFVSSG